MILSTSRYLLGLLLALVPAAAFSQAQQPNLRPGQMVVARHEQAQWQPVDELDATERGAGGFGHTGL